jgi:hypothetical protein
VGFARSRTLSGQILTVPSIGRSTYRRDPRDQHLILRIQCQFRRWCCGRNVDLLINELLSLDLTTRKDNKQNKDGCKNFHLRHLRRGSCRSLNLFLDSSRKLICLRGSAEVAGDHFAVGKNGEEGVVHAVGGGAFADVAEHLDRGEH